VIRLATRGSALALAQARLVAGALSQECEIVPITTSGDRGRGDDKARFVKELEEALLAGEADLAVHSAKDVPARLPEGLAIVGVPERADARDALCGASSLAELPEGAVVGTSSLRRRAQLLALRSDLEVRDLRGNVDTRLRKLADGGYDALVLATAGLDRLDRGDVGTPFAPDELVPAPGQGCLALEGRSGDEPAAEAAGSLTDRDTLICLTAERALVAALDASCRTPVGAHAALRDGRLAMSVFVGLPDGSAWVRDVLEGDPHEPGSLGREIAERVQAAGGAELLERAVAL